MDTMTITLPPPMREFVEAQARKQGFESADDYVRSIIREAQRREAKRVLDAKLKEGFESGPAEPWTAQDWDDIEREAFELAARRTRT